MSYLPEIKKGQKYRVEGVEYIVYEIKATNVLSSIDFIIAVTFYSKDYTFQENIQNVIGNPEYELLSSAIGYVEVVSLFKQCDNLTLGKQYEIIKIKRRRKGRPSEEEVFVIIDDNGVEKDYRYGNSMFKVL